LVFLLLIATVLGAMNTRFVLPMPSHHDNGQPYRHQGSSKRYWLQKFENANGYFGPMPVSCAPATE
jgi:hypothetical protein